MMQEKSIWRTLSVFVSSTFADMDAERDYLNYHVFPLINEQLRPYHLSLRVIDLRWGINTEQMDEQTIERKIMRVCFDEIERSKPFFIGLLGNRYGWVPGQQADTPHGDMSITAQEMWHGFLKRETDVSGCIFMERNARCLVAIPQEKRAIYDDAFSADEVVRTEHPKKLAALKEAIREHLKATRNERHYVAYTPRWDGEKLTGFAEFGNAVGKAILEEVGKRYSNVIDGNKPFYAIQRDEDEFVYSKQKYPYPSPIFFERVVQAVSIAQGVLALTGQAGCGKSSLYAHLVSQYADSTYISLYHSTAAGNNYDLIEVLRHWVYRLEEALLQPHVPVLALETAIARFQKLVARTPENRKTLVFIDGIEDFAPSQYTRFLSFFTRLQDPRWAMVITCPPESAVTVQQYHKSLQTIIIPDLQPDEARIVIHAITEDEHKELAKEIIDSLMTKQDKDGKLCYANTLWLSIAIAQIKSFSQADFSSIREYGSDYNRAFTAYTNKKIGEMDPTNNGLLDGFLHSLEVFYGVLPRRLFEYLSVSLNGLQEETLAKLLEPDFMPLRFAAVRSFMSDFVAELGEEKYWHITHSVCRLNMAEEATKHIAEQIANYYIAQINADIPVTDNICHYLFLSQNATLANQYLTLRKETVRARLTDEMTYLTKHRDSMEVLRFLIDGMRGKRSSSFLLDIANTNRLRVALIAILEELYQTGQYEKTSEVSKAAIELIEQLHIPGDIKTLLNIFIERYHEQALQHLVGGDEYIDALREIVRLIRPRGFFSLFLAPVSRRYYKWLISKNS